ncbi:hypothetical protein [Polyangium sp. 6x1]|uniref:hypothetical protein n=1 Tax=Polyangium sp. 6x1 TaxID=3042689 RepID=UPI002482A7C0|nr:hypothetical protein [Polyangium sp. 6x1]MDI1444634.1 hypothetical protein [Polyangium sp. 6x1]
MDTETAPELESGDGVDWSALGLSLALSVGFVAATVGGLYLYGRRLDAQDRAITGGIPYDQWQRMRWDEDGRRAYERFLRRAEAEKQEGKR